MKRGQAAMEFLMTYGWALLIVLVAIAVLASFGVFGGKGTYEACIMGVGFSCKDFKIAAPDRIEIRVANGLMDIDEFFVTINPNGRICPGVTGYVASAKLNSITSAPAPWPSQPYPGVITRFPQDSELPVRRIPILTPGLPGPIGMDCSENIANCCVGYNDPIIGLMAEPPPKFTVPCNPSLPPVCVGPVGGSDRLPRSGARINLDIFITYRTMGSSLIHSRKGSIVSSVESS